MFSSSAARRIRSAVIVLVAAALAASGCKKAPTAPSQDTTILETDLVVGTGSAASLGRILTVDYTGWLYDATKPDNKGTQFDTSIGRSPISFTLGAGQVILGWDQGLGGMKVGGIRRLTIPAALAYGSTGQGVIPGNATLVFEVTLLNVQ